MRGRSSLRDDLELQARFLAALGDTRLFATAARAVGTTVKQVSRLRASDPHFAARCRVALGDPDGGPGARTVLTSVQRETFLAELAQGRGAARAAATARTSYGTVSRLRLKSPAFARRMAEARAMAREFAEDELLCRALDGFVRVDTKGGVERRIVTQEWRPLLAFVLGRPAGAAEGGGRYKLVELTPAAVAAAKAKVTRMLTLRGGHAWADAELAEPGPRNLHALAVEDAA